MRWILVTGAGGGLGACVCRMLALSGCGVLAADRDPAGLARLSGLQGVTILRMDVTSTASVGKARARVERLADGLDGIACCAGVFRAAPLVEAADGEMRDSLEVNLVGAFRVVREFFPLLETRAGRVVLVGSECSRCAMPFTGPYTISKCALDAYADVLRRELALTGVRVAVVQPGSMRTRLLEDAGAEMTRAGSGSLFAAQLGRVGPILSRETATGMSPERVARVVVRALHSRRPRPYYRVGNDPLRAALGLLPPRVVDLLIRCYMGGGYS